MILLTEIILLIYQIMYLNDTIFIILSTPVDELQWGLISSNPNITWEFVESYPQFPWEFYSMSDNPNITFDIVKNNMDKNWCWSLLSTNPNITFDIVKDNLEYPWDWDFISRNPNVTIDIIKGHQNFSWNWEQISFNKNITPEIIRSNPDLPWDYDKLSFRDNNEIYQEIIGFEENDKYWHDETTWSRVLLDKDDEYWGEIAANINITWDIIKNNPNLPWSIDHFALNKNLTWKIIKESRDFDWDFFAISQNTCNYTLRIAVWKIQRFWRQNKHKTKRNKAAWKIQAFWYIKQGYKKNMEESLSIMKK